MFALPAANSGHTLVDRGDPASVDFSVGNFTTDGAVHDLDLSSIVPVNAFAVLLAVKIRDNLVAKGITFRKKGNTNWVNKFSVYEYLVTKDAHGYGVVFCDTDRVIEYLASNTTFTTIDLVVCGWFIQ